MKLLPGDTSDKFRQIYNIRPKVLDTAASRILERFGHASTQFSTIVFIISDSLPFTAVLMTTC